MNPTSMSTTTHRDSFREYVPVGGSRTAATMALPRLTGPCVWESRDPLTEAWEAYDPTTISGIETAYQRGDRAYDILLRVPQLQKFRVDFSRMEQVNDSGLGRTVRRRQVRDPWTCHGCTYTNDGARTSCEMCRIQRPAVPPPSVAEGTTLLSSPIRSGLPPAPQWTCLGCGSKNSSDSAACAVCRMSAPPTPIPSTVPPPPSHHTPAAPPRVPSNGLNHNLEFFCNERRSEPFGDYIDSIHRRWLGDYDRLEREHGYIQWLFPISEGRGMNRESQPLQVHEMEAIRADPRLQQRLTRSFSLMLDFYGYALAGSGYGIVPSSHHAERIRNLLAHSHNDRRITRILKSLGELGQRHFQVPFIEALMAEPWLQRHPSLTSHWIPAVLDPIERERLLARAGIPNHLGGTQGRVGRTTTLSSSMGALPRANSAAAGARPGWR